MNSLTDAQYHDLVTYIPSMREPYRLLAALMLHAGLRVGETLKLAWMDLLIANQPVALIRIDKAISKSTRTREVPVNAKLGAAIMLCYNMHATPLQFASANYVAAMTATGRPLTTRSIQREIAKIGRKAGIPRLHPHRLRHTAATRLLRVTNLRVVQQFLGHARIATTEIYTHVTPQDLTDAIARLDAAS